MSTENQNNIPEEIDLGILFKKINGFFSNISFSIFKGILFIKKNIILLGVLFILGVGLGYLLDTENSVYENEIIVTPSIGGVDYLYSKIDLLTSKLAEKDSNFFKSIGINISKKIVSIKIEPVVDIYSFINNSTVAANAQNSQNFEMIKLLSESGDINKVIKDKLTSKNYPLHNIEIVIDKAVSTNEVVTPILKFLNNDTYLNKVLSVSNENNLIKINSDYQTIKQVDSLVRQITLNLDKSKSSNLVYNNENNQVKELLETKRNVQDEIGTLKINMINNNVFIKDVSKVLNIKNNKGTNGKMKLIVPFLFILLFFLYKFFMEFYKSQSKKLIK